MNSQRLQNAYTNSSTNPRSTTRKHKYINFSTITQKHNNTNSLDKKKREEKRKILRELELYKEGGLEPEVFIFDYFRLRGYTISILDLLLKEEDGLTLSTISYLLEKKFGVSNLVCKVYLNRLKLKGLVVNENGRWKATTEIKALYEYAKDYVNHFDFGPFDNRLKNFLDNFFAKKEQVKKNRIAQALGKCEQKQNKRELTKVRYCLTSDGREYRVKQSCSDLLERLTKVYSDLAERFPERGYEVEVIKNVASDIYIAREKEKPYEVIFRNNNGLIEVFINFFDYKEKIKYYRWILRTLLYKLRLLEKGGKIS
jgi:hypothetical protein